MINLIPFKKSNSYQVKANWLLTKNKLDLIFEVKGDIRHLQYDKEAAKNPNIERVHELWKMTCFELFLFKAKQDKYFEFNFSPAGQWNFYQFDKYREGMHEVELQTIPKIHVDIQNDSMIFEVNIALPFEDYADYKISPAVILDHHDSYEYWALEHQGERPDFHLPAIQQSLF